MSMMGRRACSTVIVVVSAAVGGVFGNQISGRWDAAVVGFLIATALSATAAVWLDRLASTTQTMAQTHVDGRGARGLQIGDHNVQITHERRDKGAP